VKLAAFVIVDPHDRVARFNVKVRRVEIATLDADLVCLAPETLGHEDNTEKKQRE
jgi:hypothetical protein